ADGVELTRVGEGAHESVEVSLDRRDSGDPRLQSVARHLILVPGDEDGIDRHKADPAAERASVQHVRLAQPDHRNIEGAAGFDQACVLEMSNYETIIALRLGTQRRADGLLGAAKLGEGVEVPVRRADAMNIDADPVAS